MDEIIPMMGHRLMPFLILRNHLVFFCVSPNVYNYSELIPDELGPDDLLPRVSLLLVQLLEHQLRPPRLHFPDLRNMIQMPYRHGPTIYAPSMLRSPSMGLVNVCW